jgi:hypothetical protein
MKPVVTALVFAILIVSPIRAADEPHQHPPAPAATPYTPGLGEIMTLQQMRHSKLWFAGKERNWELAAYELDEMKEGFDDAAKYFPTHHDVPIAQMIGDILKTTVADLEKAVEAKDKAKFSAAFDKVTASCNACHQAAKHGYIVIRRPTGSPFTNQVFSPSRR